ncbi:hypothetical protein HN832_05175 [archaeon]|jgi:hypothetical protein|nr:hypothetical protein [archaeon]MBT4373758.1 hypothetical protein [archaeon]MBT4532224.1 hypothetical protein [archaeon]MBT7001448.1 hypothetical protein [archaeon]MBT7282776.1 hypothetical protein [archaeon]
MDYKTEEWSDYEADWWGFEKESSLSVGKQSSQEPFANPKDSADKYLVILETALGISLENRQIIQMIMDNPKMSFDMKNVKIHRRIFG